MRKNAPFNPALFITVATPSNPKRPGTAAAAKYAVLMACHGLQVSVYNTVCASIWSSARSAAKAPNATAADAVWATLANTLKASHKVALDPTTLAASAASGLGAGELQWCMAPSRAYITLAATAPKGAPGGMVQAAQAAIAKGAPAASAAHAAAAPAIAGKAAAPRLVKRANVKK